MKFDDEICKGISCPECSFNKWEDGCLLAKRLDEIEIIPEPCEDAQPEIIRCKDCKYSDTDNTLGVMFCWRVSYHEASEDGFCSWAKRRTNEKSS